MRSSTTKNSASMPSPMPIGTSAPGVVHPSRPGRDDPVDEDDLAAGQQEGAGQVEAARALLTAPVPDDAESHDGGGQRRSAG